MNSGTMNMSVKWVAELAYVQEVSLLGTADLAFWKDRLLKEGLQPAERDGQAQVMIISANLKYAGVRFQEISFSVLVCGREAEGWQDAAYLLGAFNSRRLFAFSERVLFSTPYYYGDVRVSAGLPAIGLSAIGLPVYVKLMKNGEIVFGAEMGAGGNALGGTVLGGTVMGGSVVGRRVAGQTVPGDTAAGREAISCGEGGWEGPVFLPGRRRGKGRGEKFFVTRLGGLTRRYAFDTGRDTLAMKPWPGGEVVQGQVVQGQLFQALGDSHFVAKEWLVREDATHAKSKTYKRGELVN